MLDPTTLRKRKSFVFVFFFVRVPMVVLVHEGEGCEKLTEQHSSPVVGWEGCGLLMRLTLISICDSRFITGVLVS